MKENFENVTELNLNEIKIVDNLRDRFLHSDWQEDNAFRGLVESIREKGIIMPLIFARLDDNTYELISGRRRLSATRIINEEEPNSINSIPARILGNDTNPFDKYIMAYAENNERENLNDFAKIESLLYAIIADTHPEEAYNKLDAHRNKTIAIINELIKNPSSLTEDQSKVLTAIGKVSRAIKISENLLKKQLSKNSINIFEKLLVTNYGLNANYIFYAKKYTALATLLVKISEIIKLRNFDNEEDDFNKIVAIINDFNLNVNELLEGIEKYEDIESAEQPQSIMKNICFALISEFHTRVELHKEGQIKAEKTKKSSIIISKIKKIKNENNLDRIIDFINNLENQE